VIISISKVQDYMHFGASGLDGNVGGNYVPTVLSINVVTWTSCDD